MNELPNNNLEINASRQKRLIFISLFISCVLLISFIIALIVITYNSKSYIKKIYDKSLQSVVEVKAYTIVIYQPARYRNLAKTSTFQAN